MNYAIIFLGACLVVTLCIIHILREENASLKRQLKDSLSWIDPVNVEAFFDEER